MNHKKGQAGIEYLIVFAILMLFIGVYFSYAGQEVAVSTKISKAQNSVQNIAKTIDQIYSLSPGSRLYAEVDLPNGILSQTVQNNTVKLTLKTEYGETDIFKLTDANVVGELPTTPGYHKIPITLLSNGQVAIGTAFFYSPSSILLTSYDNASHTRTLTISNYTSSDKNLTTDKSGDISSWV